MTLQVNITDASPAPHLPASVPVEQYKRLERMLLERDRTIHRQEQELDELRSRVGREARERALIFTALNNDALRAPERIVALRTLFEIEHKRPSLAPDQTYVPICVKEISGSSGVGADAGGKIIDKLPLMGGPWEKAPREQCRPIKNPQTGNWETPVMLRPKGRDRLENLEILAHMKPTNEERKAATGRGKPGSQPGEKREKILRACPDCGSLDTELRCRSCGTITHTNKLIGALEATEGTEPQLATTLLEAEKSSGEPAPPEPQVAALDRKSVV